MFTAVFLVCSLASGDCFTSTDKDFVFSTQVACTKKVNYITYTMYANLDDPDILVEGKCIDWGNNL